MAGERIRGERAAAALQLVGAASAQAGGAVAATAFHFAGPAAVVAIRQGVAAVAFLIIARPPVHRMRWPQLWPPLLLGASLVIMNLSVYIGFERIGLGLTVTLEFLGPLAVALIASRRLLDVVLALAAFGGVLLLTGTVPGIDLIGVGFALVGALGWAGYIVFNQISGRRLPGVQGSAVAVTTAALCTLPFLVIALAGLAPGDALGLLLTGSVAAILSTLLPNAIDITVLRRMRRELFGVLQSAQPGLAALAGFLVLGQALSWWQLAGLAVISAANAIAVVAAGRPRPGRPEVDVELREPPTAPVPVVGSED
ncbi:MAG: hypothetical protein BGO95_00315 [Micrococcales bacterium 73-13]|nr:MAG: hypothetical protein BGO95_00315 [Micrococcales bacterium 73-13]